MIDLHCGDARAVLAMLPDASVDAVVTDPPYALTDKQGGAKGFMGARWDTGRVAHDPAFWAEVLRVTRPGAFLLAFGGTRTYHRLACAIEDAGWECRDMLNWLQGSGFPKSKSCLKPSHEPIVLAKAPGPLQPLQIDACRLPTNVGDETGRPKGSHGAFPFSDDAFGNGPLTYAGGHAGGRWPPNTLFSHHPECRPAGVRRVRGAGWRDTDVGDHSRAAVFDDQRSGLGASTSVHYADADGYESVDAWTCHPQCPIRVLDAQAGPRTSGANGHHDQRRAHQSGASGFAMTRQGEHYGDAGTASRFFPTFGPDPQDAVPYLYCPKASRRDRESGLEDAPAVPRSNGNKWTDQDYRVARGERTPGRESGPRRNTHPTCKPTTLMAWLCKLVTPEGGVVLDCFAGSGSTGVACVRAGFGFIGIEQDAGYVEIARARIAHEQERRDGQLALPLGHAYG